MKCISSGISEPEGDMDQEALYEIPHSQALVFVSMNLMQAIQRPPHNDNLRGLSAEAQTVLFMFLCSGLNGALERSFSPSLWSSIFQSCSAMQAAACG
jgi:hypothetical protein